MRARRFRRMRGRTDEPHAGLDARNGARATDPAQVRRLLCGRNRRQERPDAVVGAPAMASARPAEKQLSDCSKFATDVRIWLSPPIVTLTERRPRVGFWRGTALSECNHVQGIAVFALDDVTTCGQ